MLQRLQLSDGWRLKERRSDVDPEEELASSEGWLRASVPGVVHQDLLAAGLIPDPFERLNELHVQWVGERDWLYHCEFDVPEELLALPHLVLCFDGLDTFATVWLNGECVLESDNQFVPARVPVNSVLRQQGNRLSVLFESALRKGKEREAEHGEARVWNGDPSRVYVRKAQYHYGWDWGPCLLTAGPWRDVRLEAYTARLSDIHCRVEVAPDLGSATVSVQAELEGGEELSGLELRLRLYDPSGSVDEASGEVVGGTFRHTFQVSEPKLWWPRGHGEQVFYRVQATLARGGEGLDRREVRLGLRRLRLAQEPLEGEQGSSFLFEVNNVPLFCGGYNWIPADSFTPRITPERYREWVSLAAEGNTQMLRVWGGGIYEDDSLYDACDELGILVWQDFMFACGMYPALEWFQASVREEARAAVRRLRHHPSIALWCGNNEDYQIAHSLNAYDAGSQPNPSGPFPGRVIYEEVLPQVCAELDPTRPYWPGSAYGGANPNDGTQGDRHVWDVWHGPMSPYQKYPKYGSRFVSEFGMQALPDRAMVEKFATPAERYPESRTLEHHNKAEGGVRRLAVYLSDNLRLPSDLDSYIYGTQLVQAEALAAGIRGWRRGWAGPDSYRCAGALVWQLNDCWPVTSWAVADYELRPKAAYYAVKRELAPLTVGLAPSVGGAAVWAVNSTSASVGASLQLSAWTLGGAPAAGEERTVRLEALRATELGTFGANADEPVVLAARLLVDGQVVARAALWPEPLKYLALPDPGIELERLGVDVLRLRAVRPAKCVVLSAREGIPWSDNALDLMPGEEPTVVGSGLREGEVSVQWLGERGVSSRVFRL